ncbi:penicillin-binding protein 1A [Anaerovirgula multivorans]|uniref:Penicillin-binding protein 1A n=1 Tax=Anaerovirgula multivorans TaxID=312168 RepID=A0A239E6K6_9FIRM|nr:PBP1A family penicillin-binding protein [Anaerovirgula multivorans]SNS40296.1 penicillin-binding protein 1A [Anaerovirgula multivorans]
MEKEETKKNNDIKGDAAEKDIAEENGTEEDAVEENITEEDHTREDTTEEKIDYKQEASVAESKKHHYKTILRVLLAVFLIVGFLTLCTVAAAVGFVVEVIKEAPSIDPAQMNTLLSQHSIIYDAKGEEFEVIQTLEFRDIIEFHRIPSQVKNAFIAIEDERFETHKGVDLKRIAGALLINFEKRSPSQGASTITQQLIKNLYLSEEVDRENLINDIRRKIKEAYLAIEVEKALTKDQILHTYLNTINLGQGAYGVQEAAKTYFDKEIEELTIAESALIAGITKNPSRNAPYLLRLAENVEKDDENLIGYIHLIGNHYAVLYNPNSVTRQRIVLRKMKELGYITEEEYEMALTEDIKEKLKPREKENTEIASFFSDLAKKEAIEILMEQGFEKKEAEIRLYTGGLRIYTTIDVDMQKRIEDVYENFGKILVGNLEKRTTPVLTEWSRYNGHSGNLDRSNNLVDNSGNILYFKKENILSEENYLIIDKANYLLRDHTIEIKSNKINGYGHYIGLKNFYSIDEKKNLVFHHIGNLEVTNKDYFLKEDKTIVFHNQFLKENTDFYEIDEIGNLLISPRYFTFDAKGIVQPQSAVIVLDHATGKIKAIVGGRDVSGRKILNRAIEGYRQPGSTIKPLAVYLPALDNGYTAASIIDDAPHYDSKGNLWPRNWYNGYRGITPLRKVAVDSMNVATVKLLEEMGIETSMKYLAKMGVIDEENPLLDSFISLQENLYVNDENLAALGLGGFTRGLSPLTVTAAYGSIANDGIYIKPTTIEKIVDASGNIIYQHRPKQNFVVKPEIANIMTDILKDAVQYGTGTRASLYPGNKKIPVAGKTGTTTAKADAWFAGYTPYYSAALWIGNDVPQLNLTDGSRIAAMFWKEVMLAVHEGLEDKDFSMSDKLVEKTIDIDTGQLATRLTNLDPRGNRARIEIFDPDTVPTQHSASRIELRICKISNKIAGPYCPEDDVVSRSFIKTKLSHDHSNNRERNSSDSDYRAPSSQCNIHLAGEKVPREEGEIVVEESIDENLLD